MNTIRLLDSPIAFHRCLLYITNSVTGALLLSQSIYWQNRCKSEDGWWWKTAEEWFAETGLSRHELNTAKRACKSVLHFKLKGVPARTYYRVDADALEEALNLTNKSAGKRKPSLPESGKLDDRKAANYITEITSEITSEKRPRARASIEPSPESRELVCLFGRAYQMQFGQSYAVTAQDTRWASVLLGFGVKPAEVADTMLRAWRAGKWNAKRAMTLRKVAELWNEIRGELATGAGPNVRPGFGAELREMAGV